MQKTLLAMVVASVFALSGCSQENTAAVSGTNVDAQGRAAVASEETAQSRYLAMVDSYFKDFLKLEPIYATFFGVNDYNAEFGGDLSDEYLKARHDYNTRYLAQARKIDKSALPADLQLSYDLFVYDRNMALVDETFPARFLDRKSVV